MELASIEDGSCLVVDQNRTQQVFQKSRFAIQIPSVSVSQRQLFSTETVQYDCKELIVVCIRFLASESRRPPSKLIAITASKLLREFVNVLRSTCVIN